MFQNDYTNNTEFLFDTKCDEHCASISSSGANPQGNIEKALSCGQIVTNKEWVQFFIPEIVDIPEEKPDVEGIVSINSCIEIIAQKVIRTPQVTGYMSTNGLFIPGESIPNSECTNLTGKKLIIEAILKEKITYTALNTRQSLHTASFTVPFSVFIVVAGDTPLNKCFKLASWVEDVYALQLSNRSIFKNTTIFIKATPLC